MTKDRFAVAQIFAVCKANVPVWRCPALAVLLQWFNVPAAVVAEEIGVSGPFLSRYSKMDSENILPVARYRAVVELLRVNIEAYETVVSAAQQNKLLEKTAPMLRALINAATDILESEDEVVAKLEAAEEIRRQPAGGRDSLDLSAIEDTGE